MSVDARARTRQRRVALRRRKQVELRDDERTRAVELPLRDRADVRIGERIVERERVGDDEHRRQPERTVEHADLRDLRGIGDAAGFDEQQFGTQIARRDARERIDERAADRAADAAVVELDHVVAARAHEARVDVDGTEVVDEHRDAAAVRRLQDRVHDGGLARAEIAADDREIDRRGGRVHCGARNTRPPSTVPHTRTS